jgi:predicted small secreted protein
VLKHIATPKQMRSTTEINKIMCPAIAKLALNYLLEQELISYAKVLYNVRDPATPIEGCWIITIKGLDYLEHEKNSRIACGYL